MRITEASPMKNYNSDMPIERWENEGGRVRTTTADRPATASSLRNKTHGAVRSCETAGQPNARTSKAGPFTLTGDPPRHSPLS
jgi:hypothetical protein